MSGEYRGLDEIIAFLRRTAELTAGTYRVELLWVVADDDHAVAVYRAQGERDGERSLDIEQALLDPRRGRTLGRPRAAARPGGIRRLLGLVTDCY